LASNDLLATRDNKGSFSFYTTGDPKKFKALGQKFLGQKIKKINKVHLKL
jgi:glutamate racemase